jgi:hypothetical protein
MREQSRNGTQFYLYHFEVPSHSYRKSLHSYCKRILTYRVHTYINGWGNLAASGAEG